LYETLNARIAGIIQSEKGQTMIEYALVGVLIVIVLVFVFRTPGLNSGLSAAASKINSALVAN
jgi:Flp pilus assembly pilin Flp